MKGWEIGVNKNWLKWGPEEIAELSITSKCRMAGALSRGKKKHKLQTKPWPRLHGSLTGLLSLKRAKVVLFRTLKEIAYRFYKTPKDVEQRGFAVGRRGN